MAKDTMSRREMREHCFKLLFCADFYPADETALQIEQYFESPEEDEPDENGKDRILHRVALLEADEAVVAGRVDAMLLKLPELDQKINAAADGWKTGRMGKVELTILRQAVYEMLCDEQVPQKVAINEAVELAKKFGGSDSSAFINGVLAKIATVE